MQTDYWQQVDNKQREGEQARRKNVSRFVEMYLTLGPDVMRLDGNRHDAELAEAKASAASRWYRLVDLEAQVQRETANLAPRPKNRPSQPADDQLPDRTIEKQARDWEERTKGLHVALAELKDQAKRERRELESLITKRR